jgi:hypothetical protein
MEAQQPINGIETVVTEDWDVGLAIKTLQARVRELETKVRAQPAPLPQPSPQPKDHLWFIVLLTLALGATVLLVAHGWAERPTVSIEYNVGEIIGGLLVGIGALIAALAYRNQRNKSTEGASHHSHPAALRG